MVKIHGKNTIRNINHELDSLHGHGPTQQTVLLDDILVLGQRVNMVGLLEDLLARELLFRQQATAVKCAFIPWALLRRNVGGEIW